MKAKKIIFGTGIALALSLGLISAFANGEQKSLKVDATPGAGNVCIDGVSFDANPYYKNGDTTTFTGNSSDYNAYYDASSGSPSRRDFHSRSCISAQYVPLREVHGSFKEVCS